MQVKIKRLTPTAIVPKYAKEGDSGFDLHADIDRVLFIYPGERMMIKTGLSFAVPVGHEMQIRPRSGLAFNHGITVINSPGTVDAGFIGEVCVLLINTSDEHFRINHGDRIAQGVIAPVIRAEFIEVDELDETDRGHGGLGSTGV